MDWKQLESYWHVLCESHELAGKPRAFQLLDRPIVVFRGPDGVPAAFLDRCPHRNIPLSGGHVCDGRLVCPFHGWQFEASGKCVVVPGLTEREEVRAPGLAKLDCLERAGYLWVRLDGKSSPEREPHIPDHISDPTRVTRSHHTHLGCSLPNIAENFLDPFHTPFVHAGIIRTASKRALNRITPVHIPDGLEVHYAKDQRQSGFVASFGREITHELGRFMLPGIIELEYWAGSELEFINTMYITPRTPTSSSIYFQASLRPHRLPGWLVFAVAGAAIKFALGQDRGILEAQTDAARIHGGEAYANTELDIVRRQLDYLYAGQGRLVDFKPLEAWI